MADTRVQGDVTAWVRDAWMRDALGLDCCVRPVDLEPGGTYRFDAVTEDDRVVAAISTSKRWSGGGKQGSGKVHKIRSDMFFLMMARADRRLLVFTEPDMHQYFADEKGAGRMPADIELHLVPLPPDLRTRLDLARKVASDEVTPA